MDLKSEVRILCMRILIIFIISLLCSYKTFILWVSYGLQICETPRHCTSMRATVEK